MTNRRNARLTSSLVVVVVVVLRTTRIGRRDDEEVTMTPSSSSKRDRSTIDRRIDRSINRVVIAPRLARRRPTSETLEAETLSRRVCMYVCSLGHSDHKESHHIRPSYQSDTHTEGRVYTPPPPALDRLCFRFVSSSFEDDDVTGSMTLNCRRPVVVVST